jgi:ABC-2 type transport system permease protein
MTGPLAATAAAAAAEAGKALAQWQYRLVLIVCAAAPFVFTIAVGAQHTVPSDTLFGRLVFESGLATPLVVLGFAGLWGLPVIAAAAGGDIFASEDRYRTWVVLLTRSRSRGEVFAAKVLVAGTFAVTAIVVLAASAIIAGALSFGDQPLLDLSGRLLTPPQGLARIALAWISVLPPTLAITAAAILTSVATRSSVAGVGLPVFAAFVLQLVALADVPSPFRVLVPTTAFEAWHGLLAQPSFLAPLVWGTIVNAAWAILLMAIARRIFLERDVA